MTSANQTIRAACALTETGWRNDIDLTLGADGRIAAMHPASSGAVDRTVDLLLPAPTNLHSHSFQRAMSGLTELRGPDAQDSFWTWRRLMYRFLERLTPDHVEAIAAQAFLEMAEAGYAAVTEFHYLHHAPGGQPYARLAEMADRIAAAAQNVGLGLTLLPVQYEFGGCDARPLRGGQARFGNSKNRYARLFDDSAQIIAAGPSDWAIGVAPHSLRAVDRDGLALASELAAGGPVHMHLAEQAQEVGEVEAALGARPVAWVLDNMPVSDRHCFIHCTQMTAMETTELARSDAVVGLCPITEASLGDGIFNGTAFASNGGRFGMGTDSNIQIALWEELRALEYSQRLRQQARALLATPTHSTGRALFDAALTGGAQAAARDSGALRVGALADMMALDTDNVTLAGRDGDALLDSLVFSGGGAACISDLWSAGRHIVSGGQHPKRGPIAQNYIKVLNALEQEV